MRGIQSAGIGGEHGCVWKSNTNICRKLTGLCIISHIKNSCPPMSGADIGEMGISIEKVNGNRQTVKDHTKTRRIVIIKCSVTKGALWGIDGGRENILTGNVGITKGFDQTGDSFRFFLTGHGTDSFAYFFLTVMVKKVKGTGQGEAEFRQEGT